MKIVAINGSPRKNGNTAQVLEVVRREVEAAGVEFQVFQPGAKVHPCMACYHCLNTRQPPVCPDRRYGQRHHRRLHRGGRHPAGSSGVSRRYFRQYEVRAGPADAGGGLRGESAPPQGGGRPVHPAPQRRHGDVSAAAGHHGCHGDGHRHLRLLGRRTRRRTPARP